MEPTPKTVALAFVARINASDPDGIAALMTEDHEFTDIPGDVYIGRQTMHQGWQGYLRMFPDYQVVVDSVETRGNTVILIGRSEGTPSEYGRRILVREDGTLIPQEDLQGPAIWLAEVRDGLVARWRVYRDCPQSRASLAIGHVH